MSSKIYHELYFEVGFPGCASGKEPACQCRRHKRHRFNSWVRKIPWRGIPWSGQTTSVFVYRESYGWSSLVVYSPVQSVAQSCPTLCDPMDCSMPAFPVLHQLPELAQTHVHWVGDAIQPSHPLSSPSPPVFNLSQHQGLFQGVSSSHQVAKVLKFQLQHQSFQWIFRTDFLYDWLVWSPYSPRDSQVFSNTTVQKHQFIGARLCL